MVSRTGRKRAISLLTIGLLISSYDEYSISWRVHLHELISWINARVLRNSRWLHNNRFQSFRNLPESWIMYFSSLSMVIVVSIIPYFLVLM